MKAKVKRNVKNWKWWLFLPVAIVWSVVAIIPLSLVLLFSALLAGANYLNFGCRPCKPLSKVIEWIDK